MRNIYKQTVLLIVPALILLSGCARYIPLKGTYPNIKMPVVIERPTEAVWTNLIEFLASTGTGIRTIDKASGLIVTDIYSFKGTVTYEDRTGKPVEADDWVVCSRFDVASNDALISSQTIAAGPTSVTGNITIHIVPVGEKTSLSIYLVNLTANGQKGQQFEAKSTGKLERQFIDILSKE